MGWRPHHGTRLHSNSHVCLAGPEAKLYIDLKAFGSNREPFALWRPGIVVHFYKLTLLNTQYPVIKCLSRVSFITAFSNQHLPAAKIGS